MKQSKTDNSDQNHENISASFMEAALNTYRMLDDFIQHHSSQDNGLSSLRPAAFDPLNLSKTLTQFLTAAASDPQRLMMAPAMIWKSHLDLWHHAMMTMAGEKPTAIVEPRPGDHRFRDPQWCENPVFDLIKQSYLATSQWVEDFVTETQGLDTHEHAKSVFYARRFMDALAPTNFVLTNPQVLRTTFSSKGQNLVRGMQNLARDMGDGSRPSAIRQIDPDAFKVGDDLAITPGKVVFQNAIMQLIQYTPTTKTVYRTPLLIVPPWINKFYILDLTPKKSFVSWAVARGYTVFIVSWANPGVSEAGKSFEDYMIEGPLAALTAVEAATGEHRINLIGYCIGGTLVSCMLAYMQAVGDDRVASTTFFAAQTDFTEAGELKLFIDDEQLAALEQTIDDHDGLLPAHEMAQTFNMLRANDLIWSYVVNNYLLGRDPFPLDLLFWNADSTRMPGVMHLFYLRRFYRDNDLAENRMSLLGHALDLSTIAMPLYFQSGREDHIAPAASVYKGAQLFRGADVTFMLAGSGHIAGVVNPPQQKKYQHWTHATLAGDFSTWLDGAEEHPGSWWPHWHQWLRRRSGPRVPARQPGDGQLAILEDAPGTYVQGK